MQRRELPELLPKGAKMRHLKRYEGGASAYFYVGRTRVAWVHWDPAGRINWERYYDAEGREHGPEIHRFENGRMSYRVTWRHGQRHGKAQQWTDRGALIMESAFKTGTGLDVWCDDRSRSVAETRVYRDGELEGLEQWWESPRKVFIEGSWSRGKKHGIWRTWGEGGKLDAGAPEFYVHGRKVTREAYLRARKKDESLPMYRAADDKPARSLPAAAKRCLKKK